MKEKAADAGRIIQLVIAVLFMFTGIYFLDAGEQGGLLRYMAWLLFIFGIANAVLNRILTSGIEKLKLVLTTGNVVLAAVVWFLLWKESKTIMSSVWLVVGLFYGLIAGYLVLFGKKS